MENPESKKFGRYEILGELGRGAMGVVYKARDPQIDRLVALKTVSLRGQDPDDAAEFRQRFINEAQLAGRLHHPGIVSVFDVGEEETSGEPYIVLEYVAGQALNKVIGREKKLPLAQALQLGAEIAEALDYAHEQGVTHRDIKPGNILITEAGHAKIADFGIAKLNLAHFTLPGKVLGTPAYMAPEQLSGEGADGRSDLFSLGVILYAMVSGHSPFQGNSATTVCYKVANREPLPVSALDLQLPSELDAVIAHAMAKDPAQRYQRGSELANDLKLLQSRLQPGQSTTSLLAVARTTTQNPAQKKDLKGPAAVGPVYGMKLVKGAIHKAPIRDLILAAGTVTLLVIVAIQSKLLVITSGERMATNQAHAEKAHPVQPAAIPPETAEVEGMPAPAVHAGADAPALESPSAAPKKKMRKASSKAGSKAAAKPAAVESTIVVPSCSVELAIRHQFKEATLTVWVDDAVALTRSLHGGTQKRLVVFNGVRGFESETIKVPAGKHILRLKAESSDHTVNVSKSITTDFVGGVDRTLDITFDKHSAMHLDWQ